MRTSGKPVNILTTMAVKLFLPVILGSLLFCTTFLLPTATSFAQSSSDLTQLSLEDLMNIKVYSAAKKPQKLFNTAAAIFVITPEDIRRSGATSIPELLRMVPGISVQQVNAHTWDISARGFNNSVFANKLLVLIDGRAVYTPLYGGVYWDVQDVVLEDIERIEVIRGPGGALWGANAVNGVINIITKKARDTQGGLLSAGGGTQERGFSTLRYGGHSKDWYYRVYSKYFDRAEGYRASRTANDQWEISRGGFKAEKEKMTFQGDFYEGEVGQHTTVYSLTPASSVLIDKPVYVQGGNFLGRYEEEDWSLQAYWDMTYRNLQILTERRHTFDIEYNHKNELTPSQEINWGFGYRLQLEDDGNTPSASITSPTQPDQIFSMFIQDEIKMFDDRVKLIIGSKLEHNIYTGFEVQPNVRLSYDINEKNMVWAAASRAVRTPSRFEEDGTVISSVTAPSTFSETVGSHDLSSEELRAFEMGYRNQLFNNMFLDIALYANHYDHLVTFIPGDTYTANGNTFNTYPTVNGMSGDVQGVELSSDIQINEWWKIKGGYTFTEMAIHTDPNITNLGLEESLEAAVPRHSFYARSSFDLPYHLELDTTLRYTDSFSNHRVPSDTEMDINLTKKIKSWEISLIGQNLFRSHHRESILTTITQVQRSVYAKVTYRF